LEDDFAVHCQYSDGCADGTGYDQLHGAWTFLRGKSEKVPLTGYSLTYSLT